MIRKPRHTEDERRWFANRLLRAMVMKRVSAEQLARALQVGESTVMRWCNGLRVAYPAMTARIEEVLGLAPGSLLSPRELPAPISHVEPSGPCRHAEQRSRGLYCYKRGTGVVSRLCSPKCDGYAHPVGAKDAFEIVARAASEIAVLDDEGPIERGTGGNNVRVDAEVEAEVRGLCERGKQLSEIALHLNSLGFRNLRGNLFNINNVAYILAKHPPPSPC